MANVTVYVNRNQFVVRYRIILTDSSTPDPKIVVLTTNQFRPYAGGDPVHQGDEVATANGLATLPQFRAELDIDAGGGGRAVACFDIDGTPLHGYNSLLKADDDTPSDDEIFTP